MMRAAVLSLAVIVLFVGDSFAVSVVTSKPPIMKRCSGPNEEFSECGNNSCQRNCDTFGLDLACRPICTPGCICSRGFIRNKEGICVNPADCENNVCPKKNEEFSECVSPCGETCATLGNDIICNFLVCNQGCDCKKNFYRNSRGECVSPENCDCPEFEELVICPNPCPPETCDSIGKLFKCAVVDPRVCKPKCKCIQNYKRDENGVCIPIEKCPQPFECKENEIYKPCTGICDDDTCEQLTAHKCSSISISQGPCFPKCLCAEGYLRNSQGVCVPKDECGCGGDPNAEFSPCGDVCPLTCNNKDRGPLLCPDVCLRDGGCRCKNGFVRDIDNKCIRPEECPRCGENEFFDCGSACDTTCATLGVPCPIINIVCNKMCYCINGYARDENNVCIPIKQCPHPSCNGDPNAVYVECASACPITCENRDSPPIRCTLNCKSPPCQCKPGYIEDSKGKCIKPENCPKKCPLNQVYNVCPKTCPPEQTCEGYFQGTVVDCAKQPEDRLCIPRCECKPGFIREKPNGDCIKPKQCCKDPNSELVDCPNPCPGGTCEMPKFSPCRMACRPRGCQCKKGYVKDKTGKCILLSSCR